MPISSRRLLQENCSTLVGNVNLAGSIAILLAIGFVSGALLTTIIFCIKCRRPKSTPHQNSDWFHTPLASSAPPLDDAGLSLRAQHGLRPKLLPPRQLSGPVHYHNNPHFRPNYNSSLISAGYSQHRYLSPVRVPLPLGGLDASARDILQQESTLMPHSTPVVAVPASEPKSSAQKRPPLPPLTLPWANPEAEDVEALPSAPKKEEEVDVDDATAENPFATTAEALAAHRQALRELEAAAEGGTAAMEATPMKGSFTGKKSAKKSLEKALEHEAGEDVVLKSPGKENEEVSAAGAEESGNVEAAVSISAADSIEPKD